MSAPPGHRRYRPGPASHDNIIIINSNDDIYLEVAKTTIRRPLSRHRRHERSGYEGGVQLHDVAFSSL